MTHNSPVRKHLCLFSVIIFKVAMYTETKSHSISLPARRAFASTLFFFSILALQGENDAGV